MELKTILGIDPGSGGGIALYNYKAGISVVKMPKNVSDLAEYLNYVKDTYEKPICFIEKVSSWKSDKDTGGKSFGIEKMLANFEQLKTVLTLAKIPFVQVYPQSWQHGLNLRKKGEEKAQRKKRYKAAATQYYPEVRATLWNADALCIVQFGRLKFKADINWVMERLPPAAQKELFTE
jgi:hypothetical protein